MRVLALASYPVEAAGTRFRLQQFVKPLSERGIEVTVRPFLNSHQFQNLYQRKAAARTAAAVIKGASLRLRDVFTGFGSDVVFIQREAMILGPPLFEWLLSNVVRRPVVLDLDDATYVSYASPTYGALSKTLKWFGKTNDLIKWASVVTCGNKAIAEYVSAQGTRAVVIPTVVDLEMFKPIPRPADRSELVLGWIGTHSTYPYLESIFPVLTSLAGEFDFRLKIVGAGRDQISIPNVRVENLAWDLAREISDFQSIDIGVYPIDTKLYSGWAQGKSGFKAVQYMAVGVPFVATPVGGSVDIGEAGVTHLFASTNDEWYRSLQRLMSDVTLRQNMGTAGRAEAIAHYGLAEQADKLAAALRAASEARGS